MWPPTLEQLKSDMGLTDDFEDDRFQVVLDASVEFVERVRKASYNFAADPQSELPAPTADLVLGTLRLAGRWHVRRRSPDALIQMAEMGASRVPSFDTDIDRLLGIGRYAPPVIA